MKKIDIKNTEKLYITNDLSIAAFLLTLGYTITKAEREVSGRFHFEIQDENNTAEIDSVKFLGSECFKYDGYTRMLRNMLNSKQR
jgi:hypothetical protein